MAKYFLDTNFFMRAYEGRYLDSLKKIVNDKLYVSALTLHITAYVHHLTIPNAQFNKHLTFFSILPITAPIATHSLQGPTSDYEDNLQLHTAFSHLLPTFITLDKKLLKMGNFKSVQIISPHSLLN